MKLTAVAILAASSGISIAQVTPFELGIGYGQSGRFTRDSGGTGRLEGPEITISQALGSLPFVGRAEIGASAFFGGGLSHGSDTDGTVFRAFIRYRSTALGATSLYLLAGGHWATAKGRGGSFDKVTRPGADFGVGMPIGPSLPVAKASVELMNHQNKRAQLRGWTLSLKLRL